MGRRKAQKVGTANYPPDNDVSPTPLPVPTPEITLKEF